MNEIDDMEAMMGAYTFEIWDSETRNIVGAWPTEAEALETVRTALERHGETYVRSWALARATPRKMVSLAAGQELVRRARRRSHSRADAATAGSAQYNGPALTQDEEPEAIEDRQA